MGVSFPVLDMLFDEAKERPFRGRLLTLGRQDVWLTRSGLFEHAAERGGVLRTDVEVTLSDKRDNALRGWVSDKYLFQALGFSQVDSLDASTYEGASIQQDLMSADFPATYDGMFDVIIDIGVLEHAFDIAQAMRNIHRLLKVGGRYIVFVPAVHGLDAAFFSISPTFFYDYSVANNYAVRALKVYTFPPGEYHSKSVRTVEYIPGMFDNTPTGVNGCYWDTHAVIERLENSTGHVSPRQRYYREHWELHEAVPKLVPMLQRNQQLCFALLNSIPRRDLVRMAGAVDDVFALQAAGRQADAAASLLPDLTPLDLARSVDIGKLVRAFLEKGRLWIKRRFAAASTAGAPQAK